MQVQKTVLSIDVGIKNLSFCTLSFSSDTIKILDWKNVTITDECVKKMPLQNLTERLLCTLEEHFDDTRTYDHVIIENQPMLKNGLMKTVSVVIYTYFNMLKIHHGNVYDVRFVSALNKLRSTDSAKSTYKERKKSSILLARTHVQEYSADWSKWFEAQTKKDDCADSLNQGIAFMKSILKIH